MLEVVPRLKSMFHIRSFIQGNVMVSVEQQKMQEGFGRGVRVGMPFRQFLAGLRSGSEKLYMTTQDVSISSCLLQN